MAQSLRLVVRGMVEGVFVVFERLVCFLQIGFMSKSCVRHSDFWTGTVIFGSFFFRDLTIVTNGHLKQSKRSFNLFSSFIKMSDRKIDCALCSTKCI
jgi:hypothetical protein